MANIMMKLFLEKCFFCNTFNLVCKTTYFAIRTIQDFLMSIFQDLEFLQFEVKRLRAECLINEKQENVKDLLKTVSKVFYNNSVSNNKKHHNVHSYPFSNTFMSAILKYKKI